MKDEAACTKFVDGIMYLGPKWILNKDEGNK
jgi:hypothetical protein